MLPALAAALPYIPTVISALSANRANKPTQAERISSQYYTAAADPNSDLMRRYAQAEEAGLNRDFAQRINQLLNENRRQTRLGRTPMFDPETADQSLWRAGARYGAEAGDTARSNARRNLLGIADQFAGMRQAQQGRQDRQAELLTQGAQTGTDILSQLLKRSGNPGASSPFPSFGGMINL